MIDDEVKANVENQLAEVHGGSRQLKSQNIKSMDGNDSSINKSDFTFLFAQPGKTNSRDQM